MTATPDAWIAARDRAVWQPYGIASLAATQWLDDTPRSFPGVPGSWHTDGIVARGEDLAVPLRLSPGDEAPVEELLLRAIGRDGAIAIRVLDPREPGRRGISSIVRAPFEPAAAVVGIFTPLPTRAVTMAVDDHVSEAEYAGVVTLSFGGEDLPLMVERRNDRLFATFSDATGRIDGYRFRFLDIGLPDADGRVDVDFNRAYLPPCAFSDHYVCVFPPPTNRWDIAVRAGELRVE